MSPTALRNQLVLCALAVLGVFYSQVATAQSVGVGTTSPDPNAILHVVVPDPGGTPQGMILPQLTTAQRTGMTLGLAQEGLVVYDAGDSTIYSWTGNVWQAVGAGSVSPWSTAGSVIFTTTDDVGIGTNTPASELQVIGTLTVDSVSVTGNAAVAGDLVVTNNIRTNNDVFVPIGDIVVTNGNVFAGNNITAGGNVIADSLVIYDGTNAPSPGDVLTAIDGAGKTYWTTPATADFPVDSVRAGTGIGVAYSSDTAIVSLTNVGTAGTYGSTTQIPQITTDAQGRVTGVTELTVPASDFPVDSVRAGTGIGVAYSNDTAIVSLTNVGTAGTYGSITQVPQITTDAQGRITGVTEVSIPTADFPVDSVRAGTGIGVAYSNDTAIVSLTDVGTAGTYGSTTQVPQITTDAQGRITGVTEVTIPTANFPVDSVRAGTGIGVTYSDDTAIVALTDVGTAGTYGAVDSIPVFTTDAQGRVISVTNTAVSGDNLGNHSAAANIQLGGFYLSNDGDNEGVQISNSGVLLIDTIAHPTTGNVTITRDLITGGGSTDFDGSSEEIVINSQSESWNMGVVNDASSANSHFYISLNTNNDDGTFHIDQDGDVGIGTNSPQADFNVGGTVRLDDFAGSSSKIVVADGQGDLDTIMFSGSNADVLRGDGTFSTVAGDNLGNHTATTNIQMGANYISNDGDNEGLFVDADGEVAIGHTNPQRQLHLHHATDDQTIYVTTGTNNRRSELLLQTSGGTNDHLQIVKHGPTAGGTAAGVNLADLSRVATGAAGGPLMIQVITNNNMHFVTNNLERMRILGNGNIGINQVAPAATLHVNGTMRIQPFGSATAQKLVVADGSGDLDTIAFSGNGAEVLRGDGTFSTVAGDGNGIFSGDGSLGGNTTVTQAANTLAFTSTAVNGFSVDGTTFSVDASNNRIGIGTAAPSDVLQIDQTGAAGIRLNADTDGSGNESAFFLLSQDGGATEGFIGIHGVANEVIENGKADAVIVGSRQANVVQLATNDTARVIVDANGLVGIGVDPSGTYTLEVNGTLGTTGINEMSDQRWKENIETLRGALDQVLAMRGVTYDWRFDDFPNKKFSRKHQVGLIAQEVEAIVPELVDTDVNGYKTVQYSKIVALLIEAMKEQNDRIVKLEKQSESIELMKAEINQIKLEINNGVGSK